jgi:thiol:disulfide interchange protein DsbD
VNVLLSKVAFRAAIFLLTTAVCPFPAIAETTSAPVTTERTRASLVVGADAAAPGAPLEVALRLQLKPGWHTYWRNPGDSGEPAAVTLRVGDHAFQGPNTWPIPERIDVSGIVSYGFHGDVFLLTQVVVPAGVRAGATLPIEAEATWLVCEKVCVPEQGRFTVSLPIVAAATAPARSVDPKALRSVPARFSRTADGWTLRVPGAGADGDGAIVAAYFFPERGDLIDHSAPQTLRPSEDGIALAMTAASAMVEPPSELRGILAVTHQRADGTRRKQHLQIQAQPSP